MCERGPEGWDGPEPGSIPRGLALPESPSAAVRTVEKAGGVSRSTCPQKGARQWIPHDLQVGGRQGTEREGERGGEMEDGLWVTERGKRLWGFTAPWGDCRQRAV